MHYIRQVAFVNADGEDHHRLVGTGVATRHETVATVNGKQVPYVYWSITMVPEEEHGPSQSKASTESDAVPSVQVGEAHAVREQDSLIHGTGV